MHYFIVQQRWRAIARYAETLDPVIPTVVPTAAQFEGVADDIMRLADLVDDLLQAYGEMIRSISIRDVDVADFSGLVMEAIEPALATIDACADAEREEGRHE
jgi:Fe-S-cluster formation regulator IscX/YfhJ